jgi:competence protein ComEC
MSFAAVVALVAVYEAMSRRQSRVRSPNFWARIATTTARYVGAIALTTLIASIAVAPFAAFHFHKLAQFSLVANLLAMPIFGLLVMPMALACLLAMPFGLEAWPLALMGYGLNGVTAIAAEISSWPGAVVHVAQMPVASLILLSVGGLWLCLWRGPVRSLGVAIAAAGLIIATGITRPDVLIGRDGGQIAVRDAAGSLKVSTGSRDTFALERWLLADGDGTAPAAANGQSVFVCDALACITETKGKTIALVRHPAALREECARADVVISQVPIVGSCGGIKVVIDRRDLWAGGSHAVFVNGPVISAVSAASLRGSRPWVRRPPGAKSAPAAR